MLQYNPFMPEANWDLAWTSPVPVMSFLAWTNILGPPDQASLVPMSSAFLGQFPLYERRTSPRTATTQFKRQLKTTKGNLLSLGFAPCHTHSGSKSNVLSALVASPTSQCLDQPKAPWSMPCQKCIQQCSAFIFIHIFSEKHQPIRVHIELLLSCIFNHSPCGTLDWIAFDC